MIVFRVPRVVDVIEEDRILKSVMVDGTFAKAISTVLARKSGCLPDESPDRKTIGRRLGGLTTKFMAVVEQARRLVRLSIRPEKAVEAPELITLLDGVLPSVSILRNQR